MKLDWLHDAVKELNTSARDAAIARQGQLTKPPGALGRLEELAIRLAGMQGVTLPSVEHVAICIFAGDHGVAAENVSAFPQAVTAEMIKNFARGGAAIAVAARTLGAELEVINLGTAFDAGEWPNVRNYALGRGTANFAQEAAMTESQLSAALHAGRESVLRAVKTGMQLYIGGEMGIANTTSAAALACVLLNMSPQQLAGPGTGLDASGVSHKAEVIARALQLHIQTETDTFETLRRLGGFEIAALSGAFMACAQAGIPVLVDGYIATVAALIAARIQSDAADWFIFAHRSAEPGHIRMLEALNAEPLLQLGMRLGEGSGAALAVPILRMACALHSGMATFAEAGVSEQT